MISYLLNAITETLAPPEPKPKKKVPTEPPVSTIVDRETISTYRVDLTLPQKRSSAYRQTLPAPVQVEVAKKSSVVVQRPSYQINYQPVTSPVSTPGIFDCINIKKMVN